MDAVLLRLREDQTLLTLLGLSATKKDEIVKRITRRGQFSERVTGPVKLLLLQYKPDRKTFSDVMKEQVLQVECHVHESEADVAEKVMDRVRVLLHGWSLNRRPVYYEGQLGELPSMASFVCVGSRFTYHASI